MEGVEFKEGIEDWTLWAKQPDFGQKHIKFSSEIETGKFYIEVRTESVRAIYKIIGSSEVFGAEKSVYFPAEVVYFNGQDEPYNQNLHMSDVGVEPYSNGLWHTQQHLEKIDATTWEEARGEIIL